MNLRNFRNFFYGTETRRLVMRFLEIFVLAGLSALANSVEVKTAFVAAFGSAAAATLLKFVRDLTWVD